MAHRITIANQKGGVAKTTTAWALAAELAEVGERVLLVDIDSQQSATALYDHYASMGVEVPWSLATENDPAILARLRDVVEYDSIVVDTPGHLADTEALRAAVASSDYVIVPCTPSLVDMRATLRALTEVIVPSGVPYRILITCYDARSPQMAADAAEAFATAGHPVFRTRIRRLKAISDAATVARIPTITPDAETRRAREDYRSLAAEYLADSARLARAGAR